MSGRRLALTALGLVLGLGALLYATGAAAPAHLALTQRLPVAPAGEALERGLVYSALFTVEAPSRVSVALSRAPGEGRLSVLVSLVTEDGALAREARARVDPRETVVLSAVPPGRYRLRFVAGYEASGARAAEPAPPASARAQVRVGGRPAREPLALAALLVAPALALGYARRLRPL